MAINTIDGLVAGLTAGEKVHFFKNTLTSTANVMMSFWSAIGNPGAGATPATGTGETCTSATPGALVWSNPTGGAFAYLAGFSAAVDDASTSVILYDRLVQTSGLSGTVATAQAVNTVALPRYTDGIGVEIWLEWYTATGSTSRTVTVDYTNTANAAKTSPALTLPASVIAGRAYQIPLVAGDAGVKSVQNVTLSGTTGTAGNFGVTLVRKLTEVSCPAAWNTSVADPFALGMPRIYDNACLAFATYSTSTSVGPIVGELTIAKG